MKLTDLRNAIEEIDFDKDKQEQMILEIQAKKKPYRYKRPLRVAAVFAICILSVGILSVPVQALVNSLVQERMEEVPKKEIIEIAKQVQNQPAEVDGTTREYTEGEKERRGKLYAQYLDGLFPTGELTQVDSVEEAIKHEFCFLTTTSVFYLPADRELTDEEILEQIDFEQKRDYALQEQRAEEIAGKKAAEREQIKEIVESGGVTEEQAVEIAAGYLKQIFGFDGSGMELNHYYNNPDPDPTGRANTYCVNWSDMGNQRYYYFFIDAADSTLRSMSYSADTEESLTARPTAADAPGRVVYIQKQAEKILTEKLAIRGSYKDVRSYYLINTDEGTVSRLVDVLFIEEDGTAQQIGCAWDGQVWDYSVTTQNDYEEKIHTDAEVYSKRQTEEQGHPVKIEVEMIKNVEN